uniref:Synaptosome associated protein 29 n=1 Tax=Cyprinus carpio carpio TaxID=630221 RepID=A0A8C1ECI7_CYPCA
MSIYPKSHNPFADDDDEEESKPRRGFNFDDDPEESSLSPAERRQRQLQQEVMRTAQSAVDSSHRSLGLVYESERVGAETAEELIRQGEALKRTEKMIDNMEQDMRTSQRHINTIKSVWGGVVNYFKGKPEPPRAAQKEPPVSYEANSRLQNALTESKQQEDKYQASHPSLRKLDTSVLVNHWFESNDSQSLKYYQNHRCWFGQDSARLLRWITSRPIRTGIPGTNSCGPPIISWTVTSMKCLWVWVV